jgi:hypothetical protein|tara:strand:- start:552 stop:761 length:210 start_codon:yes stop_codon:yes gene_type:complete
MDPPHGVSPILKSSCIASRSDVPKHLAVRTRWEEFALIAEEHFHAIKNHRDQKPKGKTKGDAVAAAANK